jgi:hypothetical protein
MPRLDITAMRLFSFLGFRETPRRTVVKVNALHSSSYCGDDVSTIRGEVDLCDLPGRKSLLFRVKRECGDIAKAASKEAAAVEVGGLADVSVAIGARRCGVGGSRTVPVPRIFFHRPQI